MSKKPLDYYSKSNPHGPYGSTPRPSLGAGNDPEASYLEGFSSKKNLADWAARASERSGPKFAPGVGRTTQGKGRSEQNRKHDEPPRRIGWASER